MTLSTHTRTLGITGAEATGTVTITDYTALNTTDSINLIATDGTRYNFTNGDQSSVNGTWASATSNAVTATNLMNVINTSSGPAGTRFSASVDGAVVTITQSSSSEASLEDGNTAITINDAFGVGMTGDSAFTGGSSSAAANDRGVVMNGGNVAGSRLTSKSILDIIKGADEYGSKIVVNTDDSSHQVGLTSTKGSGEVGFYPKRANRSATDQGFIIRGVSTKINNVSTSVLQVVGSGFGRRPVHYHAENYYQEGTWATRIFNLFRNPTAVSTDNHGLLQSDGTAKAGITSRGSSATFRSISAGNNTKPIENRPSRAVPGELVWLVDFADRSSSGGNFKDYSAITGG